MRMSDGGLDIETYLPEIGDGDRAFDIAQNIFKDDNELAGRIFRDDLAQALRDALNRRAAGSFEEHEFFGALTAALADFVTMLASSVVRRGDEKFVGALMHGLSSILVRRFGPEILPEKADIMNA